ncbi:tail assembly protein [Pseudomonas sp. TNT2022 ID357]|uniref:Tail assembly protein n=1 Tax=Pseudomonas idahonensis TaxID=2942628 RepID=A0ABT5Q772_9PSED|nr:tail assembly protein [Pseudomonas idahonensis]MDD1150049.1 tail assembly protein [Pseudomonas idahonensis]
MKRTVKLYGVLRKHFGREYLLDVQSPRDAVQALCVMVPGFERFLATGEERGLAFTVFSGRRNLALDELDLHGSDAEEIRIAPIIQGSKQGGMFQLVLGAVLVVAGYFTFGTTSAAGLAMMAGGAAMALGGVVQMLSPTAKTGSLDRNEDGNNPSYGFGSAVTTIAQGNPYPVLYGEREIGGAIESGGVYPQDRL